MGFEVDDGRVVRVGKVEERERADMLGGMSANLPRHDSDIDVAQLIEFPKSGDLFCHYRVATHSAGQDSGAENSDHLNRRRADGNGLLPFLSNLDLSLDCLLIDLDATVYE